MRDIGARIYHENGEYEVWIGPASDLIGNNVINSFIAGMGEDRAQAMADAVVNLEIVVEQLKADAVKTVEL